jgi:chromosome partitioning protein
MKNNGLVIAIANEKGGVGKTTTAISLGAALAEDERQVLLIDIDPQANLTLALGFKPNALQRTVADILMGGQRLSSVVLQSKVSGLFLAPSNQEMRLAEQFLRIRDNYEMMLKNAIAEMSSFDAIIIDCPPAIGALTQSALTAADLHILPTQCEYFSAHGIGSSLDLIRYIRQKTNPALRYRILVTMTDPENSIHQTLNRQIRKVFGSAVFNTTIEADSKLQEALLYSQPIIQFAPQSNGAVQYRQLAQELLQYARTSIPRSTQAA